MWAVHFANSQVGWVGGNDGVILNTIDGGKTWNSQNSGLIGGDEIRDFFAVDSQICWAGGGRGNILKTTNGGQIWNKQNSGTTLSINFIQFTDSQTGWAVSAGTNSILLKTTNGGDQWIPQTVGTPAKINDLFFLNSQTGWISADGFIYKTVDGGQTWVLQYSNNTVFQTFNGIHFANQQTGWTVGNNAMILNTENGGALWTTQNSAIPVNLQALYFIDDQLGWIVGQGGSVMKTTNGGAQWVDMNNLTTSNNLYSVRFLDAQTGWAVGSGGTILKTSNGGAFWEEQISGYSNRFNSVYFIDSQTGWVVGNNGRILKTTNAGVQWKNQPSGTPNHLNSVFFIDAQTGWATGNNGTILKTVNGGAQWTAQTSGVTGALNSVKFFDTQTGWAIGASALRTTDGGNTWVLDANTLNANNVYFIDNKLGWAATAGKVMRYSMSCFSSPVGCSLNVANTNDFGPGTLREAIECANAHAGPDTIRFQIPGTGPHVIQISSAPLPSLSDPGTVLDATTQNGWKPGELVLRRAATLPGDVKGITIAADDMEVYGMSIQDFTTGIRVQSGDRCRIGDNTIIGSNSIAIELLDPAQRIRMTRNQLICNSDGVRLSGNSNAGIKPPVIAIAMIDRVSGTASPNDSVEVYLSGNTDCATLTCRQGNIFLGQTKADAAGAWELLAPFNQAIMKGQLVTATATGAQDNTSSFADCIQATSSALTCDPKKDSTELMKFYLATKGDSWWRKDNWGKFGKPIQQWWGIETNAEGCVTCLDMDGSPDCTNLYSGGNNLTGSLPYLNLPFLRVLSLAQNQLTDTLPNLDLPALEILDISSNQLSGSIPNLELPNLLQLLLALNQLDNSIPDFDLPSLEILDLYSNQLSGPIPNFNLPKLLSLDLAFNQLKDSIPNFNLPQLQTFSAGSNDLTGRIPDFSLPNLDYLDLYSNQLTDTIPAFNLPKLQYMDLSNNELEGEIPNFFLPRLEHLDLSFNQLSGTIPALNLPKLRKLNLSFNQLSSQVPLFKAINLQEIRLSNNRLIGPFPAFNYSKLQILFAQNNRFSFSGFPAQAAKGYQEMVYAPQDSVFHDTLLVLNAGQNVDFSLDFDEAESANVYKWYKDGVYQPLQDQVGNNNLIISNLQAKDAGVWQVQVTNPGAAALRLYGRRVQIQLCTFSASAGPDQTTCVGQPVVLTAAAGGSSYQWSDGGPATAQWAFTPTATKTYTVTVTDATGCENTASMTLTVNPLPNVEAGADLTLCNQPIIHQMADFSPQGGTWTAKPPGTGFALLPSGLFIPFNVGSYSLCYIFTDGKGCSNRDSVIVNVTDPVTILMPPDKIFCRNDVPFTFVATPAGGKWSSIPASTLDTITGAFTPDKVGIFTLTYTYGIGTCLRTATMKTTVNDLPDAQINPVETICYGQSVSLTAKPDMMLNYAWGGYSGDLNPLSGQTVSCKPYVTPFPTTAFTRTYTLTVTDTNGCSGVDSILINIDNQGLDCGLVARYPLDGDAQDVGANGNHGIVQGGLVWVKDRFGNCGHAARFNGQDAYISAPHSASLQSPTHAITLAVWAKSPETSPYLHGMVTKITDTKIQYRIGLGLDKNLYANLKLNGSAINTDIYYQLDSQYKPNRWMHYAYTFDGSAVRLFLDGILVRTEPLVGIIDSSLISALEMGRDVYGFDKYLHGDLDDVRIYNRTLSPTEIAQLYAQSNDSPNPPPSATVSAPQKNLCPNASTLLSAAPTQSGYTYAWYRNGSILPGETSSTYTATQVGDYQVRITAAAGCDSLSAPLSLTAAPQVVAAITAPNGSELSCTTPALSLQGSGGDSYLWANGLGSNATATAVASGTYTVTVTNAATGCSATATVAVTQDQSLPDASANGGALTCAQPFVVLQGISNTPGVSYTWAGPNGFSFHQANPSVNVAGTYTLTVSSPTNGCSASATAEVVSNNIPPSAAVTASNGGQTTCTQPTVTLSVPAVAGNAYVWAGPGSFNSNSPQAVVSSPGIYSVTVSNAANACSATGTFSVTANTNPPNISAAGGTLTCTQAFVLLSGNSSTPGVNYVWKGPNGFSASQQNPPVNVAGTYTLTVSNPQNNCTAVASVSVLQDINVPPAAITAPNGSQLDCKNATIALSATGGDAYVWSGGLGNTDDAIVLLPGTYTVTVTKASSGCTATASSTVSADKTPPPAQVSTPNGSQIDCKKPTVLLQAASASGQTYAWSDGLGSNPTANVGAMGVYTVTITTTANGCTASATASVSEDKNQPDAFAAGGTVTCAQPLLSLQGGSATPSVGYAWKGPNGYTSVLQNPAVGVAGTYILTVTSAANGCSATSTASVLSNQTPPGAVVSPANAQITCAVDSVALQASGGGDLYIWKGPGSFTFNGTQPTVALAGTYTVTVTTAQNGCTATATAVIISNQTPPNVSATTGSLTCTQSALVLSGSSSTSGVIYAWAGPNGFVFSGKQPSVSAPGVYTLTVTNPANDCTATVSTTVTENKVPPTAVITTPNGTMLNCFIGGVALQASGNGAYVWSGGLGSGGNIIVTQPNTYMLFVTDPVNGCTSSTSVTITQDITPPTLSASGGQLSCLQQQATLQASSSTAGATFKWMAQGGNTYNVPSPTVGAAGNYTVTVTGPNGCTVAQQVTVAPALVLSPKIEPPKGLCPGGSVVLKTSGVFSTYQWSNGPQTDSIVVTQPGPYVVTVTDKDQCIGTASATVTPAQAPLPQIMGKQAFCPGDSTTLAPQLNFDSYKWSNGKKTPQITVALPGVYTVEVTNPSGCTGTNSVTVSQYPAALALLLVSNDTLCAGDAATFTAGGGASYRFWLDGVAQGAATSNNVFTLSNPGNGAVLAVQIVDGNTCRDSTAAGDGPGREPITLTVQPKINLTSAFATYLPSCPEDSVRLLLNLPNLPNGTCGIRWQLDNQAPEFTSLFFFNKLGTLVLPPLPPGSHTCKLLEVSIASTGCAAVWPASSNTLAFNVLPPIKTVMDTTICYTQSVKVFGQTFNQTGVFTPKTATATGCDSTVVLKLKVVSEFLVQREVHKCYGDPYVFYGDTLLQEGLYPPKKIPGPYGCDSVIILALFYELPTYGVDTGYFCPGTSYSFGDSVFTKPGKYTIRDKSRLGCDSITTLTLFNYPISVQFAEEEIRICKDKPLQMKAVAQNCVNCLFKWSTGANGFNLSSIFAPGTASTATYSVTVTDIKGCKASDQLLVTVLQPSFIERDTPLCPGALLFGKPVLSDTVITRKSLTAEGCEATEVLNVKLLEERFEAAKDSLSLPLGAVEQTFDVEKKLLQNDSYSGDYDIRIVRKPRLDSVVLKDGGATLQYLLLAGARFGQDSFQYALCPPNGCPEACDSAWVVVRLQNGDLKWVEDNMPNLITPGGSHGQNDVFDPLRFAQEHGVFPEKVRLLICNRWGEVVHGPEYAPWNGSQGDRDLPQATYYYQMLFEVGEVGYQIRGAVNLLR